MRPYDASITDACAIHNGSPHTNQVAISNGGAMYNGGMPNDIASPYGYRVALIYVKDAAILNISVLAHRYGVMVGPDNSIVPYRNARSQSYTTDDSGIVRDEYIFVSCYLGLQLLIILIGTFHISAVGCFQRSLFLSRKIVEAMLGLQLPTDPRWADLAALNYEFILTDHAFCEQKAASACISLIQQYPEKTELVEKLAPIVTEEWGHFRMVVKELRQRDLTLGKQRKDEYVNALIQFERKGVSREEKLLDKLLMAALIEARSCERFRVLSEGLDDERMRKFYRQFMISEAGHYRLFIDLAKTYFPAEQVKKRWQEWLAYEAELMQQLSPRGDRMH